MIRKEEILMIGLGTIVNTAAVVIGGGAGLLVKKALTESMQDSMMKALGIATMFIGLGGAMAGMMTVEGSTLVTGKTMLMILSLVLGTLAGELLDIEKHMEELGDWIRVKVHMEGQSRFTEGFVTNALVICVGAMAIVGSLQDGLSHDPSMLYAKAFLDAIISMIFASTLGIGVLFAAIPLGVYQGSITICAAIIAPFLSEALIGNLSYVGSILIFVVGLNLAFGKQFKVGNMLPAILVPVIYEIIAGLM